MGTDSIEQWRALTEHYRSMSDEELRELARDFKDLTSVAQQALRDEMRARKLGDPQSADYAPVEEIEATPEQRGEIEYTWKTPLCDSESPEHAWQIQEVLRRAGIDSWIEGPTSYARTSGSVHTSFSMGLGPKILVAADQLEQAQRIIAQPIPQDVIEASRNDGSEEYEIPVCPKCGTPDPILESAEPVNHWRCENCDAEWADELADAASGG